VKKTLSIAWRRGRFLSLTLVLFAAALLARTRLGAPLERARVRAKRR